MKKEIIIDEEQVKKVISMSSNQEEMRNYLNKDFEFIELSIQHIKEYIHSHYEKQSNLPVPKEIAEAEANFNIGASLMVNILSSVPKKVAKNMVKTLNKAIKGALEDKYEVVNDTKQNP